ncbi:hypothetical protein PG990_001451 [Apiospora arundinis]
MHRFLATLDALAGAGWDDDIATGRSCIFVAICYSDTDVTSETQRILSGSCTLPCCRRSQRPASCVSG